MKILISPSKTQLFKLPENFSQEKFESILEKKYNSSYYEKSREIKNKIEKILLENSVEFKNLKIKDDQALLESPAIFTYTGLVFKQLEFFKYDKKSYFYMENNLRILSAFYGILCPYDFIKPYRLDFNTKIKGTNLYNMWSEFVEEYFSKEDMIVDLASKEYSKMISIPKITIHFRQIEEGAYKNKATYGKMARGQMVNFMILKKINSIKEIKNISFDGYSFNEDMSDGKNFYFVKNL